MEPEDFVLVYATYPDRESAARAADMLVARRLAACVNIHAPCTSVYRWQGKTERAEEIPVVIKTRKALGPAVIRAAGAEHPYDTPCFLTLPIAGGAAKYLDWLAAETTPDAHEPSDP